MAIPYVFLIYSIYIFPKYVPYIFPCVFLNLWSQEEVRTWPKSEFWFNFARFGSRNCILMKFIDDSAWLLSEKLKNHIFSTQNRNIWKEIPKIFQKIMKISKDPRLWPCGTVSPPCFAWVPCGPGALFRFILGISHVGGISHSGPISDFWCNFACFGFKIGFLIKFLNDSAWFCLEKLKQHIFSMKNFKLLY